MVSHLMAPEVIVDCLALSNNAVYLISMSEVMLSYAKTESIVDVWSVATGEKVWTAEDLTSREEKTYIGSRCEICGSYGIPFKFKSIAISDDGMVLCTEPSGHEMVIWSEGKKIFKLPICSQYFEPYFDIESPYILTQLGRIHLDKLIAQGRILSL